MTDKNAIQAVERAEARLMEQHIRDPALAKTLAYQVRGEPLVQPSYKAYLMFVIEMSQKGEPMEIVKSGVPELAKPDEADRKTWYWHAHKILRNKKTGHESEGIGYAPYLGGDEFTTRKVLSTADRNAIRGQIPELSLRAWLTDAIKKAGSGSVQAVDPVPADVVAPEDREAVEAARRQMGIPPGGPNASPSSPPPEPSAPATQAPGRDSSTPGGGDGDTGDADDDVPDSYWGVAKDGRNEVPTLSQMRYLTAEGRGANRMTKPEVKAINRFKASELTEKFHAEEKGA